MFQNFSDNFIGVCTDTYVIYQGFFSEIDEHSELQMCDSPYIVCNSNILLHGWKEEILSFQMIYCL